MDSSRSRPLSNAGPSTHCYTGRSSPSCHPFTPASNQTAQGTLPAPRGPFRRAAPPVPRSSALGRAHSLLLFFRIWRWSLRCGA